MEQNKPAYATPLFTAFMEDEQGEGELSSRMNWKIVIDVTKENCPYLRITYNKKEKCAAFFFLPPYKQKHCNCTHKNCPYKAKAAKD